MTSYILFGTTVYKPFIQKPMTMDVSDEKKNKDKTPSKLFKQQQQKQKAQQFYVLCVCGRRKEGYAIRR